MKRFLEGVGITLLLMLGIGGFTYSSVQALDWVSGHIGVIETMVGSALLLAILGGLSNIRGNKK